MLLVLYVFLSIASWITQKVMEENNWHSSTLESITDIILFPFRFLMYQYEIKPFTTVCIAIVSIFLVIGFFHEDE